jgi:hypothetical protein
MIDLATALFAGAMLATLPYLLLRVLQEESSQGVRWRIVAWPTLALLAWGFSLYLVFLALLPALLGFLLALIVIWRQSRKPRIVFQEKERE